MFLHDIHSQTRIMIELYEGKDGRTQRGALVIGVIEINNYVQAGQAKGASTVLSRRLES